MRIRNYVMSLLSMGVVSVIVLIILGVLTYNLKWKADTAMLGITVTYILAGFAGGVTLKWGNGWRARKEERNISEKMLEGIIAATIFMGILFLLSIILVQEDFAISGRFLMIWMLLSGSACLGRIL